MTGPLLIDEQLDAYVCFLKVERGLSRNTLQAYGRDLGDFLGAMVEAGHTDAQQVTARDVAEWARSLARARLARSTQKRMLVAVRGFFRFLVQRFDWPENPTDHIALPKQSQTLPAVIAFEEVERLLNSAPLRDRALVALWYGAGLRVSEAVHLPLSAMHLDAGLIRVRGKGDKERIVPLGTSAVSIIEAYLHTDRPRRLKGRTSEFLFPGRGKSGALTRQAAFCVLRRLALAAGLSERISPHTLRHAFATHLVQGGADLRSVQTLLGHTDLKTTEIYTHLDDRHVRQTYEQTHPRA